MGNNFDYKAIKIGDIVTTENGTVITIDGIKNNNDLKGFTNDNKRALFSVDENKWLFGRDISKYHLVDLSNRTLEERKLIGSKGGKKAQENREAKKNFNELAKSMIETALTDKQARTLLGVDELPGFIDENNLNVGAIMIAKGIQECIQNGSFKWFEAIRDTSGYKPKNEVQLEADIMTEADRQLIDNISQRIG